MLLLNGVRVNKYLHDSGTGLFVTAGLGQAMFDSFGLDVQNATGYGCTAAWGTSLQNT